MGKIEMIICRECGRKCKSFCGLSIHIEYAHMEIKDYYDKYLKKEGEGICLECKKETNFTGLNRGYRKYCSTKCSNNSLNVKQKKEKTLFKNFGVNHPSKSKQILDKIKNTNILKFGSKWVLGTKYCLKKTKQTSLNKYGTMYPNQSKIVKQNIKKSLKKKYGIENISQLRQIKEKKKQTNLKNRGVENPNQSEEIKEKKKQTNLKNRGVEYPTQNKEVIEKSKQASLKKYGTDYPNQSDIVKKKIKESFLEHFGKNHWTKTENGKLICRKNFIKTVENQLLNNEPLSPRIGIQERIFLNELQKYTIYNIIRNDLSFRYIIGRFPDGHIKELKLFIQFDERYHFLDKECKIYKQDDIDCTLQLASLGYIIWRVSDFQWKENKQKIINEFKILIESLKKCTKY